MVKNEADIIESFVRHTCLFVDKMLVCDHLSSDRTKDILELLRDEGLPIEIFTFDRDEFVMEFVINNLCQIAIEQGADIILPLDADEFLIDLNGNSKSLRQCLANLDPHKTYVSYLWDYSFADTQKGEDKYALSRDLIQYEHPYDATKMIIGREFAISNQTFISRGNHALQTPDNQIIDQNHPLANMFDRKSIANIYHAHFETRSENQVLAKNMCSWITTITANSRYTPYARYLKQFNESFLKNSSDNYWGSKQMIQTNDLYRYRDECQNRYTQPLTRDDVIRKLYALGKSLANRVNRDKILLKNQFVKILVMHEGNPDATIRSLESAIAQTYPYIEISILLLTTRGLDKLHEMKKKIPISYEISYLDAENLQTELENSNANYFQFILSGDELDPDKILHSIETLNAVDLMDVQIVVSNLTPSLDTINDDFTPINVSPSFEKHSDDSEDLSDFSKFSSFTRDSLLIPQHAILISGISRTLFNSCIFKNCQWIQDWLKILDLDNCRVEASSAFFFLQLTCDAYIGFLNEPLVTRGMSWTRVDLEHHLKICQQIN